MRILKRASERYRAWPYLLMLASCGFFVNASFLASRNDPVSGLALAVALLLVIFAGRAFSKAPGLSRKDVSK